MVLGAVFGPKNAFKAVIIPEKTIVFPVSTKTSPSAALKLNKRGYTTNVQTTNPYWPGIKEMNGI